MRQCFHKFSHNKFSFSHQRYLTLSNSYKNEDDFRFFSVFLIDLSMGNSQNISKRKSFFKIFQFKSKKIFLIFFSSIGNYYCCVYSYGNIRFSITFSLQVNNSFLFSDRTVGSLLDN